ncbi:MAG TPA: hypothetical protein PLO23_08080 [Alphaproteobacteria bacterium]|nr:hypothetical protein [Alphaproteobacteria bacterium]
MKDEFEARAVHITDVTLKHEGGEHPFDVIQIFVGDGMMLINRQALQQLRAADFNWSPFKRAIQALPSDPFTNEI